ncbi:potential E3 ubiquitin-protein ligase ariadne-2-like isoform X1 [Periplaneta americana]|uniref:potential E3 ubiquitin-protein ligase ariadne-2-like isoform X1 n=1 Tax=Periplaneta americana TaxID=6978 RepID=UPI0037E795C5
MSEELSRSSQPSSSNSRGEILYRNNGENIRPRDLTAEECDSDMEYSDDDGISYEDYYKNEEDYGADILDPRKTDPEYFVFDCLTVEEIERLLNESVEKLSNSLHITPSLAKVLLHAHKWSVPDICNKYHEDSYRLLVWSKIKPPNPPEQIAEHQQRLMCPVCVETWDRDRFNSLSCGHLFCKDCWIMHFEIQITQGYSTSIGCMAQKCDVLAPEDFVLTLLSRPSIRHRYQRSAFQDYVKSHPQLRFCPGPNCEIIIKAKDLSAKRATCNSCKTTFCFKCGTDYHAPTDCETIKKWLTKCADDSETANYFVAHTKDCPKCNICIEKNGGCNHMLCYKCKYEFCWVCLGDWELHGTHYYECSRYKDGLDSHSVQARAREALTKYLHYYERWDNHSKSLKLEEMSLQKMKVRINTKVMNANGTWIDWQFLYDAAILLAKCRYTLQYTYPYAYYMEPGPRKELFEYQQAQLEAEIENLAWMIERTETSIKHGDLENQMDIAEKRRMILLKDFLEV